MQPLRAISLKLLSVGLFVVMGALIKAASGDVPPGQAVFFRSIFAMPVILVWLAAQRELSGGLRTRDPWGHLLRGLLGGMAMGCFFTGLAILPLPEITAITFATPLFITVLAAFLLGEKIRLFRIAAVCLGLVGLAIIIAPTLGGIEAYRANPRAATGTLIVLGGSFLAALAQIQIRRLVAHERTATIVFWYTVTTTVLALLTLPFGWVWPTPLEATFLVSAGLVGGTAQIFLTSSYRFAGASVVAPFDYASMLWAMAIG